MPKYHPKLAEADSCLAWSRARWLVGRRIVMPASRWLGKPTGGRLSGLTVKPHRPTEPTATSQTQTHTKEPKRSEETEEQAKRNYMEALQRAPQIPKEVEIMERAYAEAIGHWSALTPAAQVEQIKREYDKAAQPIKARMADYQRDEGRDSAWRQARTIPERLRRQARARHAPQRCRGRRWRVWVYRTGEACRVTLPFRVHLLGELGKLTDTNYGRGFLDGIDVGLRRAIGFRGSPAGLAKQFAGQASVETFMSGLRDADAVALVDA